MFTIDVPKDVRKIKPKFIGPFTFRQTIWGLIGGVAGYAGIAVQKWVMGPDVEPSGAVVILFCAIPALIGFIPIMDMPAEQFFKHVFVSSFVYPRKRTYEIKNYLKEEIEKANKEYDEEQEKILAERMKNDKNLRKSQQMIRKQEEKQRKQNDEEFLTEFPALR